MSLRLPFTATLLCSILLFGASVAAASPVDPDSTDDDSASETASAETPVSVQAGEGGFFIRTDDEQFQLRIGGDIQVNSRFFDTRSDITPLRSTDSFFVRRMRILAIATVFERFDLRVMPNWGFGQATLQDAFVNARFATQFNVRAGKFKPPVGLEFLQSPSNLFLYERAYPTSLVPGRDVGIMVYGSLFDERLDYAVGAFNGPVDGQSLNEDTNDAKDFMARLFAHPFQGMDSLLDGIGIGIAGTIGNERIGQDGASNLPRYRTPGRQTFFSHLDAARADGQRARLAPQAYWYAGPFGAMFEYVASRQAVREEGADETADLTNQGWQVSISQVITGEDASYGRVEPDNPYDGDGQWGAFELAARVHGIQIDADAFPRFAEPDPDEPNTSAEAVLTWGVGLNWYATSNTRFSINYERTTFDAVESGQSFNDEGMFIGRFQVAF